MGQREKRPEKARTEMLNLDQSTYWQAAMLGVSYPTPHLLGGSVVAPALKLSKGNVPFHSWGEVMTPKC